MDVVIRLVSARACNPVPQCSVSPIWRDVLGCDTRYVVELDEGLKRRKVNLVDVDDIALGIVHYGLRL